MNLQENINNLLLDFNNPTLKDIRLHQYDVDSRKVIITCTDHGQIVKLDNTKVNAKIKWLKPDGKPVFNPCDINDDGQIIILCTEQMLISDGYAFAEVMLQDKETEIILHTMPFKAIIQRSVFTNDTLSSTAEIQFLTEILKKAEKFKKDLDEWEDAEEERQQNEEERKQNELLRQQNTKKAIEDCEAATNNANDAADDADDAKADALDALNTARNANIFINDNINILRQLLDGVDLIPCIISPTQPSIQNIGGLWFVETINN